MKKNLMLIKSYLSAGFLLFTFICGCNENPDTVKSGMPERIVFTIDSSLLAEPVVNTEYKFKFIPPVEWNKVSKELFGKIEEVRKNNDSLQVDFNPIYVFTNENTKSFLSVTKLKFKDTETSFKEKIKNYRNMLERSFNPGEVRSGEYLKDNIHVVQFLIQRDNQINFKLIFENYTGDILQFDYLSAKEYYPGEIKAIESSIGSIQLLK